MRWFSPLIPSAADTKPASAPAFIPQPATRALVFPSMKCTGMARMLSNPWIMHTINSSFQLRSHPPSSELAARSSSADTVRVQAFARLLRCMPSRISYFSHQILMAWHARVSSGSPSIGKSNNDCNKAVGQKKGFVRDLHFSRRELLSDFVSQLPLMKITDA